MSERCCVKIQPFSDGKERDCLRPAGHGPDRKYCHQHASKIEQSKRTLAELECDLVEYKYDLSQATEALAASQRREGLLQSGVDDLLAETIRQRAQLDAAEDIIKRMRGRAIQQIADPASAIRRCKRIVELADSFLSPTDPPAGDTE